MPQPVPAANPATGMKMAVLVMVAVFLVVVGFILYQNYKQKTVMTPSPVVPSVDNSRVNQKKTPANTGTDTTATTFKNEIALTVSQPVDKSTVTTASVTVKGKTVAIKITVTKVIIFMLLMIASAG